MFLMNGSRLPIPLPSFHQVEPHPKLVSAPKYIQWLGFISQTSLGVRFSFMTLFFALGGNSFHGHSLVTPFDRWISIGYIHSLESKWQSDSAAITDHSHRINM